MDKGIISKGGNYTEAPLRISKDSGLFEDLGVGDTGPSSPPPTTLIFELPLDQLSLFFNPLTFETFPAYHVASNSFFLCLVCNGIELHSLVRV